MIPRNAKWAVIGHGSWATAIVKILLQTQQSVGWFVRNPEILNHLSSRGSNPRYLQNVCFDPARLHLSGQIDPIVRRADVLVPAAPSAFLKTFLEGLTEPIADKFIVSAIKGIVTPELIPTIEYMERTYGIPAERCAVVSGPCHAEEVALERLSYLTMASPDIELARQLAEGFACDFIRMSCSTDTRGVEYAAIIKNIYAIAVGLAVGLGYGDNFLAVLIANANDEMDRFLDQAFSGQRNVSLSAYLGDLLVTSYSPFSRNRTLGMKVGQGASVEQAQQQMQMIAEGYYAARCITLINNRFDVDIPIIRMVHDVLYEGAAPAEAMRQLTLRLV